MLNPLTVKDFRGHTWVWDSRTIGNPITRDDGVFFIIPTVFTPRVWAKTTTKFRMMLLIAWTLHWSLNDGKP